MSSRLLSPQQVPDLGFLATAGRRVCKTSRRCPFARSSLGRCPLVPACATRFAARDSRPYPVRLAACNAYLGPGQSERLTPAFGNPCFRLRQRRLQIKGVPPPIPAFGKHMISVQEFRTIPRRFLRPKPRTKRSASGAPTIASDSNCQSRVPKNKQNGTSRSFF